MNVAREAELLALIVDLRAAVTRNEALLRAVVDDLPLLRTLVENLPLLQVWIADETLRANVERQRARDLAWAREWCAQHADKLEKSA